MIIRLLLIASLYGNLHRYFKAAGLWPAVHIFRHLAAKLGWETGESEQVSRFLDHSSLTS